MFPGGQQRGQIFVSKVLKLDPRTLTEVGFDCFENAFFQVNTVEHRLVAKTRMVNDLDLVGLDFLWVAALQTPDEAIAARAIKLLKQAHTNLSPKLLVCFLELLPCVKPSASFSASLRKRGKG